MRTQLSVLRKIHEGTKKKARLKCWHACVTSHPFSKWDQVKSQGAVLFTLVVHWASNSFYYISVILNTLYSICSMYYLLLQTYVRCNSD